MNDELKINPTILKWARDECGYSKTEIANKVHVDLQKYSIWEDTGTNLNLNELIALSKVYKRQIAFFFLPFVPKKTKKPTDYRNLEPMQAKLSNKTLLAIRRTVKFREFILGLHSPEYFESKYLWLSQYQNSFSNLPSDSDDNVFWVRNLLNFPIHEQLESRLTAENSYKRWRNSIEQNLGIYVFQFAMPKGEVQGFSYSDSAPYCITINNAYPATSRTFTLFHELSHILKNQSGLCNPNDTIIKLQDTSIEFDCNSFAGSLLVPSNEVTPAKDKETILKYAHKFNISSEVYLRRLFSLGHVTEAEFFNLLYEIRRSVIPTQPHYSKSQVNKSINSRGRALFDSTIHAVNHGRVSYSLASDILGLKINYFAGL